MELDAYGTFFYALTNKTQGSTVAQGSKGQTREPWNKRRATALSGLASAKTCETISRLRRKPSAALRETAKLLWKDDSNEWQAYKTLLVICSFFRRPRNIVALRRLMEPVLRKTDPQTSLPDYMKYVHSQSTSLWNANVTQTVREKLDKMLHKLHDVGLLVRQEGGFYWMHRVFRDTFYDQLFQGSERFPFALGDMHDAIAKYYYQHLYRPFKDTEALFEYLFHRTASIRAIFPIEWTADQYLEYCREGNHRARELIVIIRRERDHLLTSAHPGLLVPWIRYIRDTELDECHKDG